MHTHRHRAPLDRALFLKEIQENRSRLRALAGADPEFFSYPDGSVRAEFLDWLPEAGVRRAVTCRPGPATVESHPLLLPRFGDNGNLSSLEFESIVTGFASWMPHVRNRPAAPYDLSRLHASHGL